MSEDGKLVHERWKYEQNRQLAERAHDFHRESFNRLNEYTVNSGNLAVRTSLIINAGAAIALLAFVGNLISSGEKAVQDNLVGLISPLMWFVWGVAISAVATGVAYIANRCTAEAVNARDLNYEEPHIRDTSKSRNLSRVSYGIQVFAVIMVIASLVCFLVGMISVSSAIEGLAT